MFCLRYDHQTKKNLYVAVLPRAKRNEREAAYPKDARSRPLTIPGEDRCPSQSTSILMCMLLIVFRSLASTGSNQAYRAISTSQLNALPHLHLWPIDEVVYLGSQGYLVLRGASRLDAFSGYPVRS